MRQITKDFVRTALIADPLATTLVKELRIELRFGRRILAKGVAQTKGGLHVCDAGNQAIVHLIDEDEIVGVTVHLSDEAVKEGIVTVPELIRRIEKRMRVAA